MEEGAEEAEAGSETEAGSAADCLALVRAIALVRVKAAVRALWQNRKQQSQQSAELLSGSLDFLLCCFSSGHSKVLLKIGDFCMFDSLLRQATMRSPRAVYIIFALYTSVVM